VSLIFLLISTIDRFFIKHFCSIDELGIYALGIRFSSLANLLLITPFNLVWLPFALSIEKEPDSGKVYSTVLTYFLFLSLFLALAISLLAPDVIRAISPQSYWGNYRFISLLTHAAAVYIVNRNVGIGISLRERTELHLYASILALGTSIACNLVLVPRLGIDGAAISNLASFLVMAVFTFFISRKVYPIAYETRRLVHQSAIFGTLLIASFAVSTSSLWLSFLLKILMIAGFPFLLFITGFFNPAEIRKIKGILKSRMP